jgi:hypothetical protein
MIQIRLDPDFKSEENISPLNSSLSYRNGYFVNFEIGRGDLTNEFNINEFLTNPTNSTLVNAFYSFLSSNYSPAQSAQIKSDSSKLAHAFNSYYNSVIRGLNFSVYVPSNSGETSIQTRYTENLYYPNETKDQTTKSGLAYSANNDSYYVNVFLYESFQDLEDVPYELRANINNGFQIEKQVVVLNNAVINGMVKNSREANLSAYKKELINGFITLDIQDSPFNEYSNSGLDSGIHSFSGNSVFQIDSNIFGKIEASESIYPVGAVDVLIGNSKTFTFQTTNYLKSIVQVSVDGVKVEYDRLNNLSKQNAGQYTFSSVTKNHSILVEFN